MFGTPKTHETHVVTMPAFVADGLIRRLSAAAHPDDLVFTAPKGGDYVDRTGDIECGDRR